MNVLHIICWWTLLSVTLGPCLTWLFFHSERNDSAEDEAFQNSENNFQQKSSIE